MRFWLLAAVGLVGCIPTAHVVRPADAAVVPLTARAPLEIEAVAMSSSTDDEPDFGDDPLRPCTEPDELAPARHALGATSDLIASLDDGPSQKLHDSVALLEALLTLKCFELAQADLPDSLTFDTGFAFKKWWNASAYSWLSAYLATPMSDVIIPEQPLPTLFLDGHETSPLAALLCPASDADCGRASVGWMRRAETRFSRPDSAPEPTKDPCPDEVAAAAPEERWNVLRTCRESNVVRLTTLPLGRFKAPIDGLFVMLQTSSCQRLTIYDLATGARMIANGCSTVNGSPSVEVGRVPVASLREATWMTMLAGAAKSNFRPQDVTQLPANVVPGRPRLEGGGGSSGDIGMFGSRSHRVVWSWFRPSKHGGYVGQISGEQWLGPSYEANAHADELMKIANDGFDGTCAPPLPRAALAAIQWGAPGATVYDDAVDISPVMTHPNVPALQAVVIKHKTLPLCTTAL